MSLALFKERRLSLRRQLTGLLPGKLLHETGREEIVCRPVDVSKNGMGIVVAKVLEPGMTLTLMLQEGPVRLQVAWGQPDFSKHDMYRYGLVTWNPNDDLEDIFLRAGCLR